MKALGFSEVPAASFGKRPPLSFNFGNVELTASWERNRSFVQTVMISGVLTDTRSIAFIEQEMPLEVASTEEGIAWLTWILDRSADVPPEKYARIRF